MSFPNCLPEDSFQGTVDGIAINWGPNAKDKLVIDAGAMNVDKITLKEATEHFAHASAMRLNKESVRIQGSFHNTTTNTTTGITQKDIAITRLR